LRFVPHMQIQRGYISAVVLSKQPSLNMQHFDAWSKTIANEVSDNKVASAVTQSGGQLDTKTPRRHTIGPILSHVM